LIHDLIKPRKFNCVTAVSRGISSALPRRAAEFTKFAAEFVKFFPRKTVGPNDDVDDVMVMY